MSIPARVKYIVLSLLFIAAAVNFTRTTLNIIESSKRLDEIRNEVSSLEEEKEGLEKELAYKKTDSFVEEEARNKLNLVKPGEEVFIFPIGDANKYPSKVLSAVDIKPTPSTNFNRWLALLF